MKNVFILIGAPGSGKGTLSKMLVDKLNIAHISSGDMLRAEITKGSELSLQLKELLSEGKLIDDNLMTEMINTRIQQEDCKNGFILDGYPRTLQQVKLLDKMLSQSEIKLYAFYLEIDDDTLIKRITGRYACANCGAIYNKYTANPKKEGVCDKCSGTVFTTREDDNIDTFNKRLGTFKAELQEILAFYQKLGILYKFDATLGKDKMQEKLLEIIN